MNIANKFYPGLSLYTPIYTLKTLYDPGVLERTEKVPMSRISTIVSEPIQGHEQYHIIVSVVIKEYRVSHGTTLRATYIHKKPECDISKQQRHF